MSTIIKSYKAFLCLSLLIISIGILSGCQSYQLQKSPPQDFLAALKNPVYGSIRHGEEEMSNGLAVESDGWIYFAGEDRELYKMKNDGTKITKLSDDRVENINVVGENIYYQKYVGKLLYSMKIDGTGKTQIFNDYIHGGFLVVNNWIIYGINGDLYIMKKDGSNRQKLFNNIPREWVLSDSSIYFSQEGNMYEVNIATGKRVSICDVSAGYLNIIDNYIYYIDQSDDYVYRINLDGTNKTLIYNKDKVTNLNITGDKIFYTSKNSWCAFRINIDASGQMQLTHWLTLKLNVAGDWIFYEVRTYNPKGDGSDEYFIYRMKIDGTGSNFNDPYAKS